MKNAFCNVRKYKETEKALGVNLSNYQKNVNTNLYREHKKRDYHDYTNYIAYEQVIGSKYVSFSIYEGSNHPFNIKIREISKTMYPYFRIRPHEWKQGIAENCPVQL